MSMVAPLPVPVRAFSQSEVDAARAAAATQQCPLPDALQDASGLEPAAFVARLAATVHLRAIDLPGMSEHRCRAATVNLDIPGVLYGELFVDLRPHELAAAHALQDRFHRLIQRETP
jgi:hypothetical protein